MLTTDVHCGTLRRRGFPRPMLFTAPAVITTTTTTTTFHHHHDLLSLSCPCILLLGNLSWWKFQIGLSDLTFNMRDIDDSGYRTLQTPSQTDPGELLRI
ncbi:hypothetical protein CEXT_286611 [Caerostris extrusa]|uniref:Uncharacterized protein n=1 Tax=Caerostris extrusa TaxID=172846 RepID=A0AAV4SB88_CAEEX|nr:hypothetical protein CEXT_286611 [Caerostris extrusa]